MRGGEESKRSPEQRPDNSGKEKHGQVAPAAHEGPSRLAWFLKQTSRVQPINPKLPKLVACNENSNAALRLSKPRQKHALRNVSGTGHSAKRLDRTSLRA